MDKSLVEDFAENRKVSLDRFVEELSTAADAEVDEETRFLARMTQLPSG